MKSWIMYAATIAVGATVMGAAYFLPIETFLAFVIGWMFLIPATFAVYMAFGLREYLDERKNRIVVDIKPTEAMKAIARREAALKREKELLYISGAPFSSLDFQMDLGTSAFPEFTKDFLSMVNLTLVSWPAVFGGIYLMTKNRDKTHCQEKEDNQ